MPWISHKLLVRLAEIQAPSIEISGITRCLVFVLFGGDFITAFWPATVHF
jgi:hypothetical protein